MAAVDAGAVVLDISEMIDLAIGTPEVGVVDFNMLQMVLHCLAQQQRILGKNVEVRGSLVALPSSRDNVQTIDITEYAVDVDQIKKDIAPPPPAPRPKDETILVVKRVKKAGADVSKGTLSSKPSGTRAGGGGGRPASPGVPTSAGSASTGGAQKFKSQVPSTDDAPDRQGQGKDLTPRLSLVTMSKFNVLENTVQDLRNRVYGSMPKNEEILEEVRSQTNIKAITDMWTNLNASSRLEAAEAGISKLSSLVQDLINEITDLQQHLPMTEFGTVPGAYSTGTATSASAHSGGLAPGTPDATGASGPDAPGGPGTPDTPGGPRTPSGPGTPRSPGALGGPGAARTGGVAAGGTHAAQAAFNAAFASKEQLADLLAHTARLRADVDNLTATFYSAMKEVKPDIKLDPLPERAPPVIALDGTTETFAAATGGAGTNGEGGAGGAAVAGGVAGNQRQLSASEDIGAIVDKINELETRLRICCDKVGKNDDTTHDQINSLQDQMDHLSRQAFGTGPTNFAADAATSGLSPDLIKDLQGLMQLFKTVQEMQEQLKQVHNTALQLAAEKENRTSHIDALLEQIELLKTIKMDREDMADAMAEKADLRMLARKVSHDQFEMACDDLSRGLENALGKLNMQEALWQQALDDIQREIETKLDKIELAPVKDFFNNKLKQLQEHLKQMAALRREAEAAGTKRRLLRDVNCISCDANAVMPMEAPPAMPVSKPLPATVSMKPYLTYELDAIRKTQASQLPQRNMHDWENIDKQMLHPKNPARVRSGADKHMCNRYCGGSHTTTTPAQRVARLGHFIKQWGPDVLPLSSGLAAGDDGRMYRVQTTELASASPGGAVEATCSPTLSPKKEVADSSAEKPVVTAECKCLEAVERPGK